MNCYIYKSAEEMGSAAATIISSRVLEKKTSVLGLATGSTPVPVYQHMVKLYNEGVVDYSKVTTYNLDEYCGLSPEHEQSYYYFMMENLFRHINIPHSNIHVLNGLAGDVEAECNAYDAAIERDGGIDLQLLGIGINGHIGFNEPGEAYIFSTHKTTLTESTIEANKRFFGSADDVPRYAVTMGIGSIMKARSVLLVATGKSKAQAIRDMLLKDPSPACPASVLQLHSNVTVMLDEAAARLL
ncbi:MAG: glucosamine-6-phosphate deaminase [Christensenellaceae bacterium]